MALSPLDETEFRHRNFALSPFWDDSVLHFYSHDISGLCNLRPKEITLSRSLSPATGCLYNSDLQLQMTLNRKATVAAE